MFQRIVKAGPAEGLLMTYLDLECSLGQCWQDFVTWKCERTVTEEAWLDPSSFDWGPVLPMSLPWLGAVSWWLVRDEVTAVAAGVGMGWAAAGARGWAAEIWQSVAGWRGPVVIALAASAAAVRGWPEPSSADSWADRPPPAASAGPGGAGPASSAAAAAGTGACGAGQPRHSGNLAVAGSWAVAAVRMAALAVETGSSGAAAAAAGQPAAGPPVVVQPAAVSSAAWSAGCAAAGVSAAAPAEGSVAACPAPAYQGCSAPAAAELQPAVAAAVAYAGSSASTLRPSEPGSVSA